MAIPSTETTSIEVARMVKLFSRNRTGPIGVDIGSRSIKLIQLDMDQNEVCEAVRWDLPLEPSPNPERQYERIAEAIRRAREGRNFHGRDAVLCLGTGNLFVQNIRVAQAEGDELTKIVNFEAISRVPFSSEEAEIRYIEADNVKQGDTVRREVILLACHRPSLERLLSVAEQGGLRPVAVDVEPSAMLRCYSRQYRRDDDQQRRVMFVSIGASSTVAVIARGSDTMFVKYIDIGGRHFDEAIAKHLKMTHGDAAALRRHNNDRGEVNRDPEIAKGINNAMRPTLDKLAQELSLCLRYYSVTFRGQPLCQMVLGGGEATEPLSQLLSTRLDLPCELGNPLRPFDKGSFSERIGQWDVAAGLALKQII
jgi:type IV pilus assembly protein PilM